jgi:hypothetical protein
MGVQTSGMKLDLLHYPGHVLTTETLVMLQTIFWRPSLNSYEKKKRTVSIPAGQCNNTHLNKFNEHPTYGIWYINNYYRPNGFHIHHA